MNKASNVLSNTKDVKRDTKCKQFIKECFTEKNMATCGTQLQNISLSVRYLFIINSDIDK